MYNSYMMPKKYPNLIIDFDSTIVQQETLDELARIMLESAPDGAERAGQIEDITRQGMEGKIGFEESLARRLALFMPTRAKLDELSRAQIAAEVSPSFVRHKDFLQIHRDSIWIVSGGFVESIAPIAEYLGLRTDHILANAFVWDENGQAIRYDTERSLAKNDGKILAVRELNLPPADTCVIGDGMTDYAVRSAGLADVFIAYTETCQRDAVVEKADVVADSFDAVMDYLERRRTA